MQYARDRLIPDKAVPDCFPAASLFGGPPQREVETMDEQQDNSPDDHLDDEFPTLAYPPPSEWPSVDDLADALDAHPDVWLLATPTSGCWPPRRLAAGMPPLATVRGTGGHCRGPGVRDQGPQIVGQSDPG
jgi:hypothetical protein